MTVEEYASFACPGCEAFHSASLDAILDRVRIGQILFTYIPLQTGSIPNAAGAARTALCAGQQGMFWEMHDVLFDWHTRYVNTAFSQNRLLAGVEALGLDSNALTTCFNSTAISNTLTAAQNEGVASTPTIHVNGVTVTASQAGSIPSAEDVVQAIDNAAPDDWRPPGEMPEVEPTEVDEAEGESTEVDDVEAEPTEADDAEAAPTAESDDAEAAPTEADDAEVEPTEADDAEVEPTAESDDAEAAPTEVNDAEANDAKVEPTETSGS